MEIINGKFEDNDFVMNSMEQISKMLSISCQNKGYEKFEIITDISFQQTILMAIIGTPDINKENNLKPHSFITVRCSVVKSASSMFRVSKKSVRGKITKEKYKR